MPGPRLPQPPPRATTSARRPTTPDGLKRHLEQNPIEAWTGGRGTGGTPYFAYENGVFRTTFTTAPDDRAALQELARELADWRLAEYLDRLERQPERRAPRYLCKVSHANGKPDPVPPEPRPEPGPARRAPPPSQIDGDPLRGRLRQGRPQRRPPARRRPTTASPRSSAAGSAPTPASPAPATKSPSRTEQRRLAATPARAAPTTAHSSSGAATRASRSRPSSASPSPSPSGTPASSSRPGHVFLLVTLDKSGKGSDFQYKDHFLSPTVFQWESQNRTRRDDAHGRLISSHKAQGIPVHLFVRKTGKIAGGGSAPFVYCGDVEFVDWEGEKPITVRWQLPEAVPEKLWHELSTVLPAG